MCKPGAVQLPPIVLTVESRRERIYVHSHAVALQYLTKSSLPVPIYLEKLLGEPPKPTEFEGETNSLDTTELAQMDDSSVDSNLPLSKKGVTSDADKTQDADPVDYNSDHAQSSQSSLLASAQDEKTEHDTNAKEFAKATHDNRASGKNPRIKESSN